MASVVLAAPASPTITAKSAIVIDAFTVAKKHAPSPELETRMMGIAFIGAVAGHEISDKTGGSKGNQTVAAVAGAVAGAAAGKAIQDRVTGDTYNIHVRMDDGRTLVINQHDLRGIRENTYVRVVNGKVVLR